MIDQINRHCGDCQLCCRLLPMTVQSNTQVTKTVNLMLSKGLAKPSDFSSMTPNFDKPAGKRCPHQRHGQGCQIYAKRPFGCRMWSCRWLIDPETSELSRPDRSHYVIDSVPDSVIATNTDDGTSTSIPVLQIWCDPRFPEAYRDPTLLAYIRRYYEKERGDALGALIRYNEYESIFIYPLLGGEWKEIKSICK